MMDEEKVGLLFSRHPYRRGAQIDGGGYSSDGSSIPDLQTIEGFGVVVYGGDSQVLVAVVNEVEEVHGRGRFGGCCAWTVLQQYQDIIYTSNRTS